MGFLNFSRQKLHSQKSSYSYFCSSSGKLIVSEVFTILLLIVGGYFSYKYIPYQWKRMELEKIVKDQVYNVGRSNSESIREAIIKEFDALYDIQLNEEDIIIKNNQKVASITVYWIPEIRFIFDIVYEPMFKVNHARRKLG